MVRFSSEKSKGNINKHSSLFNAVIDSQELLDLQMVGANIPGQIIRPPTLERLDRCLVSKEWESLFVAKMASHAIFQYNVLAINDTHNTRCLVGTCLCLPVRLGVLGQDGDLCPVDVGV